MSEGLQTAEMATEAAVRLERLAALATEAEESRVAEEAAVLASRIAEGRYYVACVGQFKRGKSTLLDALIGDQVLPTGVVPVTSVPTVVRYGERRIARVQDRSGSWFETPPESLAEYVSEERNPENERGIRGVEVYVPSPLLEAGMCLVDTPGLGSIFGGSTEATQDFVPHIDAAVVVIGTDPPLSGAELDLLEAVAHNVPDLLFVLNKADRVSAAERAEAVAFAHVAVERRLRRAAGRIFEVSAKERLDGVGQVRDWDALVDALNDLAGHSGRALALRAAERGLTRLAGQLLSQLDEARGMLIRPIQESERRTVALGRTLTDAERALDDLGPLFTAEQERLSRRFAARRAAFVAWVRPLAGAELAHAVRPVPGRWGPSLRRVAMGLAQEAAKRYVLPWLDSEQQEAEHAYRKAAERFVTLTQEFLQRLGSREMPEMAQWPDSLDLAAGFVIRSRFYFNDLIRLARPASPLRFALDALLGMVGLTQPILADAERFLDWLLEMNSTRVESDLNERVLESRRRLEAAVRMRLHDCLVSADRALARARSTRAAGAPAVQQELTRITRLEEQVRELVSDQHA
jgi:hypothetical protein